MTFTKMLDNVWGAVLALIIAAGAGATLESRFGEVKTYGPKIARIEARVDTLTTLTWCMFDSIPRRRCPVHDGFRFKLEDE